MQSFSEVRSDAQNLFPIQPEAAPSAVAQRIEIFLGDRWLVYFHLQDLQIPCWCLKDGSLWVEVESCATVILIQGVIRQLFSPRRELVTWLNRCWSAS